MAVRIINKNQMVLKRIFAWTHRGKVVENYKSNADLRNGISLPFPTKSISDYFFKNNLGSSRKSIEVNMKYLKFHHLSGTVLKWNGSDDFRRNL